ncbi:hypothetical protein V6N13_135389 [Hibiscus sabdariffa]|uniref:Uncharacterized protein n=1 Tax=Hibiscus sabdariffa TaxID=183260 RepID=A0ABR2R790_9ROSI
MEVIMMKTTGKIGREAAWVFKKPEEYEWQLSTLTRQKVKVTANLWRPSFLLEDFRGDNDVNKEEDSEHHPALDLNLKPAVSKQEI